MWRRGEMRRVETWDHAASDGRTRSPMPEVRPWRQRLSLARQVQVIALTCVLFGASGCEREARRFQDAPKGPPVSGVPQSELRPGSEQLPANEGVYSENAWAASEGQRNFQSFNCNGCHANGGGGIGPALMDDAWLYGGEAANIFASIVEGRPNGMPSFRGRINDQQVWQLVAFVRSLSGQLRKDVEPGRQDAMSARPAPQSTPPEPPTQSK